MNVTGLLILDKPQGISSNAALSRVKRLMGTRKAGHTGCLDPLATGVLPICLGEATKLSSHLLEADKSYDVTIRLGITTTTGDAEGDVTSVNATPVMSMEQIHALLAGFTGRQLQIPPMYSALKHHGKRLYELARQGIEVERKAREVEISSIALLAYTGETMTLSIRCSKGTYIRSLAMDIGDAMACGAHVTALRRTATASFTLEPSVRLDQLEDMAPEQRLQCLLDLQSMVLHIPEVRISAQNLGAYLQGQPVVATAVLASVVYRCTTENGDFLGMAIGLEDGRVRAKRLLMHKLSAAT